MDCFDEDEFADDIDWSSIPMPTPTPKRQRLANDSNDSQSRSAGRPASSGLLSHLEMAQEYTPPTGVADGDVDREIGDELQKRAIQLSVEQGKNLFLTGKAYPPNPFMVYRLNSNTLVVLHATDFRQSRNG